MEKLMTCPYCGSTSVGYVKAGNVGSYFCDACKTTWFDKEELSAEDFKLKFSGTVNNLIHGSVKQMAVDKVKGSFTMTSSQKLAIATSLALLFGVRDRRNRGKIKELKKTIQLLNMENDFLITFVKGVANPNTNKEQLLKNLGDNFQFLSLVKDV